MRLLQLWYILPNLTLCTPLHLNITGSSLREAILNLPSHHDSSMAVLPPPKTQNPHKSTTLSTLPLYTPHLQFQIPIVLSDTEPLDISEFSTNVTSNTTFRRHDATTYSTLPSAYIVTVAARFIRSRWARLKPVYFRNRYSVHLESLPAALIFERLQSQSLR